MIMKQWLFLLVLVMFISAPLLLFAQANTLTIYASQGNLNDIIEADTLANGAQAHAVYRLVSRDTTYKFTGAITATSDITVLGVLDPVTARPPCIQPAVLPDGSIPPTIFTLNGAEIKGKFQNLYLLAKATNNTANADGIAIQVSADKVRLSVDNCVFDGWQAFAIGYNGNWDDFFVTNSHFRNMVHPNQWYIGEVIRNEWPGEAYTDTMSFVGNTMLCINGYAAAPVTKWYTTYFEFINNKVVYTFKNPFFIFNVTDGKINNNIFYANYSGGVDQTEHPWWDNLWEPDSTYGVIAFQALSDANKALFNPANPALAEGLRRIEVKNNIYFWPKTITDFWATWNSTQTNKIRTPKFMNDPTIAMFADDAKYPYLVESGNVNKDPGFKPLLDANILNGTTGNDIGFLKYFEQIRTATAATDVWGFAITQVGTAADWKPAWPLPEASLLESGQPSNTLDIYASQGNLNDIIEADTLANGAQAHAVYRLVSRDTTYKFTGAITATSDITVLGVLDPVTARPPCIQPAVLPDGSIPPTIFTLNGAEIKGKFQNLYLLAKATNNTANADGIAIQVSADKVRLSVDNCVFDGWQAFAIGYNGNWDDFFVTNSHFRNMVHPNQWYIGEVIRNEWPGEAYTDTMSFVGNTMLCINGYAAAPVTKWYTTYFEFINNKVVYTFKNPFFIFNVTDGKINNNIFYANYSGGVDQTEHPWWDNLWEPDSTYGVIAFQALSDANKALFNPANPALAEGLRRIEVKNNIYFWPKTITDFWATWNSTQTNKIRTPKFMNDPTIAMFADDAKYPYLVESGNVNKDPGFKPLLDANILNGTTGNDIGFLKYFEQIRTATAATDVWGFAITQVGTAADWKPAWPLPEADLLITSVANNEQAEGLPEAFELLQNYPNPFNPTTSISYKIPRVAEVKLSIYNLYGQKLRTLVNERKAVGAYTVEWDGKDQFGKAVASGVYFYRLEAAEFVQTRKMLFVK